ncbi:MAG: DUF4430 domain-containing protein [Solirubrobacteraceae bacterium]
MSLLRTSPLLLCLAVLAGCGLGAGPVPKAVQLTVTREFGARALRYSGALKVKGQETVMSLLMRNYHVSTRYGGGFVQGIDGVAGGQDGSQPLDWFYYVNGVQASVGAAAENVHPGDHIWWDRHDWSQTDDVPAVVGSFPEPFLNGIGGKRYPVRVECAQVGAYACNTVVARLRAVGVPTFVAALGSAGEPQTLRVMVGPWSQIEGDLGSQGIQRGPRSSGVYALFSPDGSTLTPLSQSGGRLQALHAGAGLVAATRNGEDAPVWVVTGTDAGGVSLAARHFNRASLQNRFAVAFLAERSFALPEAKG